MDSTGFEWNAVTLDILAWVITYGIHSTILIGSVWLATALLRDRISHATADVLWKTALLGAIATAAVQHGAGLRPMLGTLDVSPPPAAEISAPEPAPARDIGSLMIATGGGSFTITAIRDHRGTMAPRAAQPVAAIPGRPMRWPAIVLGLVALGAVIGATRLALTARRLRRQLRGRRDVIEDPLLETYLALCQHVGLTRRPRLTLSDRLRSPVAMLGREICVPRRVIADLDRDEQRSMLAHELAHVVRRDPQWLVASAIVEALFFFQPLNRVARRGMQQAAELLADDWAVRHTGSGVPLARCLAEVAAWLDDGSTAALAAPMASRRSPVRDRVARLLRDRNSPVGNPTRRLGITLGALVLVTWIAPGAFAATPAGAEALLGADARPRPHATKCDERCSRYELELDAWFGEGGLEIPGAVSGTMIVDLERVLERQATELRESSRRAREPVARARQQAHRRSVEARRRGERAWREVIERESEAHRRLAGEADRMFREWAEREQRVMVERAGRGAADDDDRCHEAPQLIGV